VSRLVDASDGALRTDANAAARSALQDEIAQRGGGELLVFEVGGT
jgi:hypothetical protein